MYIGRTAVDPAGNKIGSVGQVYLNDQTGQPDWITVNTGLFGMKENFAPLAGSSFNGDDLVLPFDKTVVKDSPDIADASHLDVDEQQSLYAHYQQYLGTGTGQASGNEQTTTTTDDAAYQRGAGYDTSGPNTDQAMTRSEEHLRVGTEKVEAGRARLRKYVVTEQQSVRARSPAERCGWYGTRSPTPPRAVRRRDHRGGTRGRVDRRTARRHHRSGSGATGRLGTETVTEQQTVTGEVRKEQIEVDDPTTTRKDR
jgi:stress response protein YsnF